jgi:hypothetical protein
VPLLQEQDLEHHQGRIAGGASGRSVNRRQQSLERRPIERLLDPIQKSAALPKPAHHRIHERRLRQVGTLTRAFMGFRTAIGNFIGFWWIPALRRPRCNGKNAQIPVIRRCLAERAPAFQSRVRCGYASRIHIPQEYSCCLSTSEKSVTLQRVDTGMTL